jgi:uncharacterized protein (TIGR02722 family)
MKNHILLAGGLLALAALAGCGSPQTSGAQYIDPNGQRAIVNENRINYQDFNMAANDLVQDLLRKGVIQPKHPGKPTLVAISRIVNETDQQFDTDQLVSTIRAALLQAGNIEISNMGLNGSTTDPLAQQVASKNAFEQNQATPNNAPDYTLYGKIISDKTSAGDVKQSAYIFDLQLTDVSTQTTVWEKPAYIVKQGKGPSIGF